MRYTRKLINRKRKKIRNMKGGTKESIAEAIDETIKLAKQIAKLSFSPTYSNTSQMEDLLTQMQITWETAKSGENVLNMSNNVTDDEKSQLRELELELEIEEELAESEKEFKNEGKGIKRKSTTKRSTKKRKQKGGGQMENLKKAANDLDIALQNINNYSDINTKKGIERNLLISKLLILRKIKELESRPPPPPSRNSSSRRSHSRRSATRKSKSVFSCFPGMSCTNAKGIRKKRRRRTRRKR